MCPCRVRGMFDNTMLRHFVVGDQYKGTISMTSRSSPPTHTPFIKYGMALYGIVIHFRKRAPFSFFGGWLLMSASGLQHRVAPESDTAHPDITD